MTNKTNSEQNQLRQEPEKIDATQLEMREVVQNAHESAPEYMNDFRETMKTFSG